MPVAAVSDKTRAQLGPTRLPPRLPARGSRLALRQKPQTFQERLLAAAGKTLDPSGKLREVGAYVGKAVGEATSPARMFETGLLAAEAVPPTASLAEPTILLKRVGDMRPGVIKFLQRVTSGKTGEMLRELVPSLKLEGGTLHYAEAEIGRLVDVMKKLGAPEELAKREGFLSNSDWPEIDRAGGGVRSKALDDKAIALPAYA